MPDAEIAELGARVDALSTALEELKRALAQLEPRSAASASSSGNPDRSRRELLRFAGAAMLGAAGTAALSTVPVAATAGGPMLLGAANDSDATTSLGATTTTNPIPILRVAEAAAPTSPGAAATFAGSIQAFGGSDQEGIDAFTPGASAFSMYGVSDAGYGVVGKSVTGISMYAHGTGRLLQDPNVPAGPPPYIPNDFEQVRDGNGLLWISGSAGAWRRVNTTIPVPPVRLIDTRPGFQVGAITGPLQQGHIYTWIVGGANGIPSDAVGIVGNVTAVAYTSGGYLTLFPTTGGAPPLASSVNFGLPGQVYAWGNHFLSGVGTGVNAGRISVYIGLNAASDNAHVIVDLFGYVQ